LWTVCPGWLSTLISASREARCEPPLPCLLHHLWSLFVDLWLYNSVACLWRWLHEATHRIKLSRNYIAPQMSLYVEKSEQIVGSTNVKLLFFFFFFFFFFFLRQYVNNVAQADLDLSMLNFLRARIVRVHNHAQLQFMAFWVSNPEPCTCLGKCSTTELTPAVLQCHLSDTDIWYQYAIVHCV
jgi:hypothetical protein